MKEKQLVGQEAAHALKEQAIKADRDGLSWSLDPTVPGEATFFRVTIEGNDTPMVIRLLANGTWSLAK